MQNNKTKPVYLLLALLLAMPTITLADRPKVNIGNPIGESSPDSTLTNIVQNRTIPYFLTAAGSLAVIGIIIGGVLMITAGDNKERYEQGIKSLIYSISGLAVVLLAYVILYLVGSSLV